MTSLSEIIRPGDVVVVKGFPEFFRALVPALENAVGVTLADWDHKPDIYLGEVPTDDPEPDDDRVYVFYVGAEARNRASLCRMASVILEATNPTFARVLKAERGAATSGLGLQLLDGKPAVTRLPQPLLMER